jgi:TPR repeat protein
MSKTYSVPDEDVLLGMELAEQGELVAAFNVFIACAERGHPIAAYRTGLCFDVGEGVNRDANRALYWYRRAWRGGAGTGVCINVASLYASMDNPRLAVRWWRKAAELGDGDAAVALAEYLISQRRRGWEVAATVLMEKAKRSSNISREELSKARAWLRRRREIK